MLNPLAHRKILKKGMPGRAMIVEKGMPPHDGGRNFNLPMTLQVHVEGVTPFEVEDQWMTKATDYGSLAGSIPVMVDREDHTRVAIDWERLREDAEQAKTARREALAAGGAAHPGAAPGGAQVIDARNLDPDQLGQMLGQLGVSAGGRSPAAAEVPSTPADDQLSQLERLSALRASGALTEEEFEQQKRRILGD
jgi:hypothetical protein